VTGRAANARADLLHRSQLGVAAGRQSRTWEIAIRLQH
jgi:hypothetical protein